MLQVDPKVNSQGYKTIKAGTPPRTIYLHRAIAETFLGFPPSDNYQVAHYDGNRTNNSVSNLRWVTQKENEADKRRHGTDIRGSSIAWSKLDEQKVRWLREEAAKGTQIRALAATLGVSYSTARYAIRGINWQHVSQSP